MKKPLISFIALALFVLYCPFNAIAKAEQETPRGSITVTGQASDSFIPDSVFITVSVETVKKTVSESVADNSQKAEKVISGLKKLINETDGDYIKTTSFNVDPVWEYDKSKDKSFLTGYRVVNQIKVKTKQIKTAGKIIDSAVSSGANNVQNINFAIENNREYCKSLLVKASQNAREQADVVAKTFGSSIEGIEAASVSCGTESVYPQYETYMAKSIAVDSVSTPVESGTIKMNASVNVKFYLANSINQTPKVK
jgi:uncharacterized protein